MLFNIIQGWRGAWAEKMPGWIRALQPPTDTLEAIAPTGTLNGKAMPRTATPPTKRLYVTYIRIFAAFGVILIHSTGTYLQEFDPSNPSDIHWWTANAYCSLLRWATPFFILLSGSIFLNPSRPETTRQFLNKRINRVLLPFIFWGGVYIVYQYRGSFDGGDFPKMTEVLHKIFFEDVYYHLWFIPMITGLYLLTPVFRIFISNARRSDVEYFLVLAFTITAVQHLVPGFFIAEYIGWLGYIGFYVLGYYLTAYPVAPVAKKVLYPLGLAMPFVTALGTWWLSMRAGAHDQTLFNYFSPNVVLMTISLFIWLKEYDWRAFADRHPRLDALAQRLALLSFGVYFVHVLILDVLKNGYIGGWQTTSALYFNHAVHPVAGALLQALTVALLSAGSIYLLSKIKGMQKWLM